MVNSSSGGFGGKGGIAIFKRGEASPLRALGEKVIIKARLIIVSPWSATSW